MVVVVVVVVWWGRRWRRQQLFNELNVAFLLGLQRAKQNNILPDIAI
jgi:hypothetical protein